MSQGSLHSRTFGYARVSTEGQTPENQLREIEAVGFKVETRRTITETISGSTLASQSPGFAKLLDRLEDGDMLVVTKHDHLGRDAIDVTQTMDRLAGMGVRAHCLALSGVDLTSAAGRMTMQVLNAVAQFERDLLIERTKAGLERAKSRGVKIGRPAVLDDKQEEGVKARLADGQSVASLTRELGVSRQSVMRVGDKSLTDIEAGTR